MAGGGNGPATAADHYAGRGEGGGAWLVDAREIEGLPASERLCYATEAGDDGLQAEARPLKLIQNRFLVLDRTPFYPEAGGQIGDVGEITGSGFRFDVTDTRKVGDVVVHVGA